MSLKDRVLIVLRGSDRPLASYQIARIIGVDTQSISNPLCKLCAYGQIERSGAEKDGKHRWRGLYRIKPKEAA